MNNLESLTLAHKQALADFDKMLGDVDWFADEGFNHYVGKEDINSIVIWIRFPSDDGWRTREKMGYSMTVSYQKKSLKAEEKLEAETLPMLIALLRQKLKSTL